MRSKATGDGREVLLRRKDAWIWTDARSATGGGGKNGGLWTRLVGDKPNSIGRSSADPRHGSDESLKISPRRSSTDTVKAPTAALPRARTDLCVPQISLKNAKAATFRWNNTSEGGKKIAGTRINGFRR
jgi:hypothetical protein